MVQRQAPAAMEVQRPHLTPMLPHSSVQGRIRPVSPSAQQVPAPQRPAQHRRPPGQQSQNSAAADRKLPRPPIRVPTPSAQSLHQNPTPNEKPSNIQKAQIISSHDPATQNITNTSKVPADNNARRRLKKAVSYQELVSPNQAAVSPTQPHAGVVSANAQKSAIAAQETEETQDQELPTSSNDQENILYQDIAANMAQDADVQQNKNPQEISAHDDAHDGENITVESDEDNSKQK